MKILILGGTSYMGKAAARHLSESGHQVHVFTRGLAKASDLRNVTFHQGDRREASDLKKLTIGQSWDVVIDNLAFNENDIAIALKVFENIGQYVLNSTVSVYRFAQPQSHQPIVEDCVDYNLKPTDENPQDIHWSYARGKLQAEALLRDKAKVPWTILRPPVVYGPDDPTERGFWYLQRARDGKPILLADGGTHSFKLVYSADAARAFVLSAGNPAAHGKVYNLAQKEILTLRQFIQDSALVLGATPRFQSVPLEFLGETLAGPYGKMINLVPDTSAIEKDLGFKPTPWSEFCAKTAQWFQSDWVGSAEKLLKNRAEEVLFAQNWQKATQDFPILS